MKTNPNPEDESAFLDAILADDEWAAVDSAVRRGTRAALRSRRRKRLWGGTVAVGVGALALTAAVWWRPRAAAPASVEGQVAMTQTPEGCTVIMGNFSEDQLLAMFPKGSCVFAEVDGKRQFFILDEKLAAAGFRARRGGL
jgi:hypothetical protein